MFLTSGLAVACEGSEVDEVETGDGSNIGTDMRFSITVGAIFSLSLQRSVEAHQLSHVWLFVGISSCASNNICCASVGNRSSRQWSFSCCPQAKRRRARAKKKIATSGLRFFLSTEYQNPTLAWTKNVRGSPRYIPALLSLERV